MLLDLTIIINICILCLLVGIRQRTYYDRLLLLLIKLLLLIRILVLRLSLVWITASVRGLNVWLVLLLRLLLGLLPGWIRFYEIVNLLFWFDDLFENFSLQGISKIVGMFPLLTLYGPTFLFKGQLDSYVKLLGRHLFKSIILYFHWTFAVLDIDGFLEEWGEGINYSGRTLPHLGFLHLPIEVAQCFVFCRALIYDILLDSL